MKKMTGKNTLMLFLTAFIWGTAFVAQSVGMDYIGPFTFTCVRSLIGGIFLIPCICFLDKWRAKNDGAERQKKADRKEEKKNVILGGICCGLALCVASNLQQIGIQYTTVGKAGFITALYIVLVPIFGIFLKKKAGVRIWISVAISVAGLYLLCITDKLVLAKGDILVLLCAVIFTIHILVIDYFSPKADGVRIACTQFFITGVLSAILMFLFETPRLSYFRSSSTGTLCRSSLKWCSLYPPDRGTKRCRSNRGIPDPQSGVRILCPRRLGDIRSETKYPRNSRMHSDVQRHHPRSVARKAGK